MNMKLRACALMIGLSLINQMIFAGQNTITYKNERGSILTLNFHEQKILTGTFTTAVASKDCQEVIGVERPIIGYLENEALTFSVSYPTCGSVVGLTGHINQNKDQIDTIAMIVHQTKAIGSQMITHDTFKKIE